MIHSKIKLSFFIEIVSCAILLFVSCKKEPNTLSVNPQALTFSANTTESQTVVVTTDASSWEYDPSNPSWIKPTQSANFLTVKVGPHSDTGNSRSGTITVSAGTATPVVISITQEMAIKNTLSISPTSLVFKYNEANVEKRVNITTTSTGGWDFSSDASWIDCAKNNNELIVKIIEINNNTEHSRNAVITVTAGSADPVTLTVTQEAAPPPTLSITPDVSTISFPSTVSDSTLTITSNTSWTAVSSAASWLTVSPASGVNDGSVTVSASANSDTVSRSGIITFFAEGVSNPVSLTVTQEAAPSFLPVFSITPDISTIIFPSTNSDSTLTISSNTNWTAVSSSTSWLTVSPASGLNDGSVTVSASANPNSTSRRGTVIFYAEGVANLTITIFQSESIAPAQVRFRKSFNTPDITQLGVFAADGSVLASFTFGSLTGISDYYPITSGFHQRMYYEKGTWEKTGDLYNFQEGRSYTFELSIEDADYWYFVTSEDGVAPRHGNLIQQDNSINTNSPEVIAVPKKR